jgi:hypothetical protein
MFRPSERIEVYFPEDHHLHGPPYFATVVENLGFSSLVIRYDGQEAESLVLTRWARKISAVDRLTEVLDD